MRRGSHGQLIYSDDFGLVGVNLGWDFTAEHEWGIKRIQEAFGLGLNKKALGGDRDLVTCVPESLREFKLGKTKGFCFCSGDPRKDELSHYEWSDDVIVGAWSGEDFAVGAETKAEITALKAIHKELKAKNAYIMLLGSANPFSNAGLHILIADKVPKKVTDAWRDSHIEAVKIRKEWDKEAGNLKEELKKAGCEWFALANSLSRSKSDGKLRGWLNPMRQQANDFGWFTVAEFKQWAKGEGPIPKKD